MEQEEKVTLFEALESENRGGIEECLSRINELDQSDKNLSLMFLCYQGAADIVKQLIAAGADINSKIENTTPIAHALYGNHPEIALMLMEHGADLSLEIYNSRIEAYEAPIESALFNKHYDIVEAMLDSGKDLCRKSDLVYGLASCIRENMGAIFSKLLPKSKNLNYVFDSGRTVFIYAIDNFKKTKDSFFFDNLIGHNLVDINFRTILGTPAEYAVRNKCGELAKKLIEHGADIKSTGKDGTTLLHIAADNGDKEMIEYLIGKGIPVNIRDMEDETPFMRAVFGDHRDAVLLLYKLGAKINVQGRNGMTPLMLALINKNLAISAGLLKCNADLYPSNSEGRAALRYAAMLGNTTIMDLMLKAGEANPNKRDNNYVTPLMTAARSGTIEAVKKLLDNGAELEAGDDGDRTPLMYAASASNREMLNLLLLRGANIEAKDKDGFTPLMYAVIYEQGANAKLLIQKGANIFDTDKAGENVLHIAAKNYTQASLNMSDLLMDYGAQPNIQDEKGNTPLMIAVQNEDVKLVNCLLARGANPNIPDKEDYYPLFEAVNKGNKKIINSLIKYRADVNVADKYGYTALMYASVLKDVEISDILVSSKANVNAKDKNGMTALMHAAAMLNTDIVSYLVKRGKADVNLTDNEGTTAEDYASTRLSVMKKALSSEEIDEKDKKKIKKSNIGFDLSGDGDEEPKRKKKPSFEDAN